MSEIGVGVIGLGHNGLAFCERYARNTRCKLVAVCDIDERRVEHAVSKFGVKGYNDYNILYDRNIQAISIHTPDCLHMEPFTKALETGHHVLVEKPMADTIEDVKIMVEAAKKYNDRITMVGHILRFDRYFSLIKKWISMGTLGRLFYLEADYIHDLRCQYLMEQWKVKKEIPMLGGGCHPLDLLRWYAGNAVEVYAASNHIAYPEMIEDATVVATYLFESGALGKVTTLYGNVSPRPYAFNLSLYGTKGSIVRDKISLDGMGDIWMDLPDKFDPNHDFSPEIDHFLECIAKNNKPLITVEDASNTVIAALYAIKSYNEGVKLKIPVV